MGTLIRCSFEMLLFFRYKYDEGHCQNKHFSHKLSKHNCICLYERLEAERYVQPRNESLEHLFQEKQERFDLLDDTHVRDNQ